MNEKMLELYKKAHVPSTAIDPSNNMPYETTIFSAEEFSKLIIKECISVPYDMWDKAELNADMAVKIEQGIKEHFGLEE